MNEKGVVANLLALVESDYGKPAEGGKVISMSTWAQYILDNHATVAEAVADLKKESFRVQTVVLPTGRPANMHLCISDPTGDSAIFEYVKGKLVVHHGKEYKVMTNSPIYDKQLAIMEYWKEAGGLLKSLPGTSAPRTASFGRRTCWMRSRSRPPRSTSAALRSRSSISRRRCRCSRLCGASAPRWALLSRTSRGSPRPSGGPSATVRTAS